MSVNLLKICGVRDPVIARRAVERGADFLGFIFWRRSPRYVSVEQAAEILAGIPDRRRCRFVGVFLDADEGEIREISRRLNLDIVQVHGTCTAATAESLRKEWELWRAVSSENGEGINFPADAFLVDSKTPGSGKRSDWSLAEKLRDSGRKVVLAGGISAENLPEAAALQCYALDVNSSLEDAPGQKSLVKLEQLLNQYKEIRK